MTREEIESIIREQNNLIWKMAWQCWKRLQAPRNLSVNDLYQEGRLHCLVALPKFDSNKGKIETYIYTILLHLYTNLVRKSYRNKEFPKEKINRQFVQDDVDIRDMLATEFLEHLTPKEIQYIDMVIEYRTKHKSKDLAKMRKTIRAGMNIKPREENRLLQSIQEKIHITF